LRELKRETFVGTWTEWDEPARLETLEEVVFMLSIKKYASLCALGMEIFYVLCLLYEFLLPEKGRELHRALFELLPGFVWGNVLSMVWGAVFLGIAAWITGSYIAWMHNASLIAAEVRN
jgi:2TM family of unknown function (DUF5676)